MMRIRAKSIHSLGNKPRNDWCAQTTHLQIMQYIFVFSPFCCFLRAHAKKIHNADGKQKIQTFWYGCWWIFSGFRIFPYIFRCAVFLPLFCACNICGISVFANILRHNYHVNLDMPFNAINIDAYQRFVGKCFTFQRTTTNAHKRSENNSIWYFAHVQLTNLNCRSPFLRNPETTWINWRIEAQSRNTSCCIENRAVQTRKSNDLRMGNSREIDIWR